MGASAASGQLLLSMSYENLDSSFDASSSILSTSSIADSSGSVTRFDPATSRATFDEGFADFSFDLTISNITPSNADGAGSFVATDTNGDTFSADVSGTFTSLSNGNVLFFGGLVDNVAFTDVSGDGTFDGNTGSFSTDFSAFGPLTGALQRLELRVPNFFTDDFSGSLAEVDAQFVPAPASLALLGLGGLAAVRRRR